jgi:hypothetical protein
MEVRVGERTSRVGVQFELVRCGFCILGLVFLLRWGVWVAVLLLDSGEGASFIDFFAGYT